MVLLASLFERRNEMNDVLKRLVDLTRAMSRMRTGQLGYLVAVVALICMAQVALAALGR